MKSITISESFFEHLLSCLANQKFIRDVNADGISEGIEKVKSIQEEMQQVIDKAYHEGMVLLLDNRKDNNRDDKPDEIL